MSSSRDSLQRSLAALSAEKDSQSEKASKYVAQLKAKAASAHEASRAEWEDDRREASGEAIKQRMEQLYAALTERVNPTEIYEGSEALAMVKSAIKHIVKQSSAHP